MTRLKCYNTIPVFSKDVWNDNRKGVSCRWQICFEITKCCHSWTSIQKKGKIFLQIPLRQGGVHEAKKRQDLSLCSKLEVFIWRHVVYVPKLSTTFRGILICVIFRPRDMQEYYVIRDLRKGCGFIFPVCFLYRLSRFPIHECLFILCIAYLSLCTFHRGVSWNSRL